MRGTGKNGEHLYPALPYTSYAKMKVQDVGDLYAYLKTLPAQTTPNKPHQVAFPFNIRLALGGWKFLYLDTTPFTPDPAKSAAWNRGHYLVEGPGHCAECHSPRDALGGIIKDRRFAGGMDAEGKGWVPNITPHADGIATWKQQDIADFLKSGMTPDFDSAGGSMAEVIQNTSRLTDADRSAMAEYLVSCLRGRASRHRRRSLSSGAAVTAPPRPRARSALVGVRLAAKPTERRAAFGCEGRQAPAARRPLAAFGRQAASPCGGGEGDIMTHL